MISVSITPDFATLFTHDTATALLRQLNEPTDKSLQALQSSALKKSTNDYLQTIDLVDLSTDNSVLNTVAIENPEQRATDWLITVFNVLFAQEQVRLVQGEHEPEYFPATKTDPARIKFAHGFFASALHEISHWCIAGSARRELSDFGYWYAPDGRSQAQQQAFERVEIKPQALECLFTLACQRPFQVSQDNLFATFDTSASTFAADVYNQAQHYIAKPQSLPRDAKILLWALLHLHTVSQ